MGVDLYGDLWPGARPTGTHGRAVMGPGWQVRTPRSFDGVTFQSPPLEVLRVFDLLDLGYDPTVRLAGCAAMGIRRWPSGIPRWRQLGFPFQYMALIRGEWELVTRVGA